MKNLINALIFGSLLTINGCENPKVETTSYKGLKVELQERTKRITMIVEDSLTGHKLWAVDYGKDGEINDWIYRPSEVNSIRDSLSKHFYTPQRIYECLTIKECF